MITAKCWVCRDRKHGALYCNKCADSMERKAAAWDELVEYAFDNEGLPARASCEVAHKLIALNEELENDDDK